LRPVQRVADRAPLFPQTAGGVFHVREDEPAPRIEAASDAVTAGEMLSLATIQKAKSRDW
jgi:hypothetical protein